MDWLYQVWFRMNASGLVKIRNDIYRLVSADRSKNLDNLDLQISNPILISILLRQTAM